MIIIEFIEASSHTGVSKRSAQNAGNLKTKLSKPKSIYLNPKVDSFRDIRCKSIKIFS